MGRIRRWMYVGVLLLYLNVWISFVNLLPNALGYCILIWCLRKLNSPRYQQTFTILGTVLALWSLFLEYYHIQATAVFWTANVAIKVMDMLFFYILATVLYEKRQEDFILIRRSNLMMIRTIGIVAFCLQLNLPGLSIVRGIAEIIYLFYILLAILPLCKEPKREDEMENYTDSTG